ncbi:unnamed protein product [Didymodactylos carnosus]|uniref:Uncharacterized protein n=1 Tax=Didymodactylos carnosus TaxID=1234261 RepID=A0A8S2DAA3_9BILA|nr:unnamed protein product [Didymodactylos carnosus]CAF3628183.1 unnamed protein product [Didymodactylos carnosus]
MNENEFYRLWFTQDNFYKLPKAFLCFDFRNPLADFDPIHENMNLMYCLLVDESLNESLYLAKKGGLAYDLSPSADGIQLIVCGYNQKLSTLLNKIIDKMINIQINQQQFDTYKELVRQSLQNLQCRVPYEQVDVQYLITEHVWAREELLSCIDGITVHDLELFIPRMLSRFYIEALMYGNLTKEQALDYMTNIQQQFHNKQYYQPLFPTMLVNHRSLILPEGCNYAYKQTNDAHQICAIEIYLQCFEQTLKNNAIMELFCHLVKESCGDQLRTKEQLGYVVFSGYERSDSGNSQGFYITIQSSLKLDYVNLRIETYIDSIREYITTMSDDIYCKQREGYIIKKLEISKSMSEQGILWFNEIVKHQYCFNRSQLQTDIIATLERQDLLKFYDHYIAPNSVHRRKLAVHVVPSPLVAAEIIQEPTTPTPVLTSPSIIASTPMSNGDAKIIRTLQRQQNIISPPITPSTPISKDDGTRIRTLQRQQSIMSPPITPSTPMSKDDGTRIRTLQRQLSITSKTIATPIEKLTVEPVICNLPIAKALDAPMNQTESTNEIMIENIMKNEKQLTLPETVWLENIPKWKSTLSCYPLAQSYANIDLPV